MNNKKDANVTFSNLRVIFCTGPSGTSETGFITSPGATRAPYARTKPEQSML